MHIPSISHLGVIVFRKYEYKSYLIWLCAAEGHKSCTLKGEVIVLCPMAALGYAVGL